ncbi:Energy-coupling factor transporter transmembrane protein EcfT [Candidatus Tiddalikarchaeum anstoanum]|nr:Energy-coupling factor transporter transmembrane protein EcfT [Candidatus Tiddalikarchaeum anstoanum]
MPRTILISYIERDSLIHKLNPLTKLTALICVIILAFILGPVNNLILFALILPLSYISKLTWDVFKPIRYLLIIFAILFSIQGLFYPFRLTPLYTIPFTNIIIWKEGIIYAAEISARLLVMMVYGFLFVLTTHPGDLVNALRKLKMPYKVGYIVLSTLHVIPSIQMQVETIIDAQKSRGLDVSGNIIKRLRAYVPLLGPLFIGSVQQAVERTMALEARAFSADCEKTSFRQTVFRKRDRNIIIATVIISVTVGVLSWIY